MQYGDEVQVLATGPIISRKALQPLGISDGSTCWGLWTGGLPVRNPNRFVSNWQLPHLIISPIHPEDWATSFHIRAVLRDNQGSLLRFLDSFKDCGVDLHFTDCAFGGYDHVVLNAIGQFDELRDWRRKFVDFYRENAKDFDKLWQRTDTDHVSLPDANHFVYADALMKSLQVSAGPATQSSNEHQRQAKQGTEDLMRRHALEWLGRKMLGRMIALGIVIRLKEYELFHAAWDAEVEDGKRPPIKQWKSDGNSDMDPVGDYFFTSKAIQTGRRPWNI